MKQTSREPSLHQRHHHCSHTDITQGVKGHESIHSFEGVNNKILWNLTLLGKHFIYRINRQSLGSRLLSVYSSLTARVVVRRQMRTLSCSNVSITRKVNQQCFSWNRESWWTLLSLPIQSCSRQTVEPRASHLEENDGPFITSNHLEVPTDSGLRMSIREEEWDSHHQWHILRDLLRGILLRRRSLMRKSHCDCLFLKSLKGDLFSIFVNLLLATFISK